MKNVVTYLVNLVLLSSIIMLLFSLPLFIDIRNNVHTEISKFDQLSFDANLSTTSKVYFNYLDVAVDGSGNLTTENVFINDRSIQICMNPLCRLGFKEPRTIVWRDYQDLTQHTDEISDLIVKAVLVLLPVFLVMFLVFTVIKYLLFGLIFTGLGIFFLRILNKRLQISRIFKTAMFALTPAIILNIVNITLRVEMFYLPTVISLFYFVVGLIISAEKGFKS